MSRPPPSNLAEVLPSNRTPFMVASAETDGNRTLSIDLPLRALFDPDICPPEMLDILAYTWSVDEWEPGWSDAQKREAIRLAPEYHRRKGTVGALKRAMLSLGYAGLEVAEWFDYGGEPYRFRITLDITDRPFDLPDYQRIVRAALRAKNVRSHLEAVATRLRYIVAGPYIGAAHAVVFRARVTPARPPRLPVAYAIGRGVVLMPLKITARVAPMPV